MRDDEQARSQPSPRQTPSAPPSFVREVGEGLKGEVRSWLRWGLWGAGLSAPVLGIGGLWFFGLHGLLLGVAIGVVAGGLGALLLYLLLDGAFS